LDLVAKHPQSTRISGLLFNGLQPRNHVITWITVLETINPGNYMVTTHFLTAKGWKAELAWLANA